MPASATPQSSPTQDLVRLVDFAAASGHDRWRLLDKLLEARADVHTHVPSGRYFAFFTRTSVDPFQCGEVVVTVDNEVWLDLVGRATLLRSDVEEMARLRSSVALRRVKARWDEWVEIDVGGPLVVTLEALSASADALTAAASMLPRPPKKPSQRDLERLIQGDDALLTVRRAAELLPGDEKLHRSAIPKAGITRVIERADGVERKKDLLGVRWGDVLDMFPTEVEQVEAAQLDLEGEARRSVAAEPRRKRRPRKGGIHLADLD